MALASREFIARDTLVRRQMVKSRVERFEHGLVSFPRWAWNFNLQRTSSALLWRQIGLKSASWPPSPSFGRAFNYFLAREIKEEQEEMKGLSAGAESKSEA